jgi:hypothetical protein
MMAGCIAYEQAMECLSGVSVRHPKSNYWSQTALLSPFGRFMAVFLCGMVLYGLLQVVHLS